MQAFAAMAWNGFREARRNRVTLTVAVFALLALLSSTLVTGVSMNTYPRVLTDVGLGSMTLILVFLAVFLSSGLLGREIERRTIFLMVSKPISRTTFLLARLTGNLLTLLVLLVAMSAIFFAELALNGIPITVIQLLAAGMLFFELLVLASMGFLFSTFCGQTVSAIATVGLFFAGHVSGDIYRLAQKSHSTLVQWIGKGTYYVLPNLERLNFRPMATYRVEVAPSLPLAAIAYALAYSAVALTLGAMIFNRRDFR